MNFNYRIVKYNKNIQIEPIYLDANTFCISSTNEYLDYTMITVSSIIKNTNKITEIIILTDDICVEKFIKRIKKIKSCSFTLVFMDDIECFDTGYWPKIIAKRILLFSDFFKKYKKILSIESDVIIYENIDSFFIDETENLITASLEYSISNDNSLSWILPNEYIKYLNTNLNAKVLEYNIDFKTYLRDYLKIDINKYVNAGVFMITYKFLDFCNVNLNDLKKYIFIDQDYINTNLKNYISINSFDFNFNIDFQLGQQKINSKSNKYFKEGNPKIIHFSNGKSGKPWNAIYKNKYYNYWWKIAIKYKKAFLLRFIRLKLIRYMHIIFNFLNSR